MRPQASFRNVLIVFLASVATCLTGSSAIGQPLTEAQPVTDVQGSSFCGVVLEQAGNSSFFAGSYLNVKFCLGSDGTRCVGPATADLGGNYAVAANQAGPYYMFAWRDANYWGSSTQALTFFPLAYVPSGFCFFLSGTWASRPRPLPPDLVAPAANATVPYNQAITLQWTPETDPLRVNPSWPIVYDVFASVNGGSESQLASTVACCSNHVSAGTFGSGSSVSWRAVAKMNTKVGAHGDQNYVTSSNSFAFNTSLPDDFSIDGSPSGATLIAGGSAAQFTITTKNVRGPAQSINLSVSGLPLGVDGAFSSSPITAGSSSTLSLIAVGNAPGATATFTITGTGTTISHSVTATLTVLPNTYSLSINPSSQSVDAGQSAIYSVVTGVVLGQPQVISLSLPGLPNGVTGSLGSPSVVAGQNCALTVSTSSAIAPGTYSFTVRGTAASGPVTATGSLIVNPPRMKVIPAHVRVPAHIVGASSTTGTVEMSAAAPAGGLTVSLASSNPGVASVPSTVFVPAGATVSNPFTVTTSAVSMSTQVTITATYQGSSATATFFVDPAPTVSVAWIKPAEVTWGPPGTLTVAGYAQNGTTGVTMTYKDTTLGGPWTTVPYVATPDATNVWYNTIPTSNNCHTYQVYATYSGVTSSTFTYTGLGSTYCSEAARVIWMQPQALAGFGPPGSIVLAGSATGAPAGTLVQVWTRDVTAGAGFSYLGASPPDGSGIWYQAIQGANSSHVYAAYVTWDAVTSATCSYAGNNAQNWCP